MTDPTERRELRNEAARLVAEHDRQRAEHDRTLRTADPIRIRVAAAEREWKQITAEWDALRKPRDGRTIAERGQVLSDLERIAAERRQIYTQLAAAMTEQVEIDLRIARLGTDLHNLAAKHYEINRLLSETE